MAGAFSLFTTLLMLSLPLYVFQIFDRVLTSRSVQTLTMLMLLTGGSMLVLALLDLVRRLILLRANDALDQRLTGPILDILFEASRRGPHPGIGQALADLATLRGALTGRAQRALTDLPWISVFLIAILPFNPWLLLLAAIVTILMTALALLAHPLTVRRAREAQKRGILADSQLEERLRHAPTLAAMGMTPAVTHRWRAEHDARSRNEAKIAQRLAQLCIGTRLLRRLGVMGMWGAAAWLYIDGLASPAAVIAVGLLADRAFGALDALVSGWHDLVAARGARERLKTLFEQSAPPRDPMPLPVPTGAVSLQQIIVVPPGGRLPVLKAITLDVPAGGSLGIIGPSGAGKSALARTLVGLWPPLQGTARLDGNDLRNWDMDQLGLHVGYLSQDIDLMDGTVAENIARMGPVDADGVVEAARRVGIHETLLRLPNGYDTAIGQNGHVLPAGLRQRVALARAVYGDPRLIVLDEPNSALDAEGEQALLHTLKTVQEEGRTVVMITQKPALIAGLETILVLRDGQIEMMGPRQTILARFTRRADPAQGRERIASPRPPLPDPRAAD